jgi:hypothetical protein
MRSLKHGTVNTGGVTFFTANFNEYRVSFDDCCSPAKQLWEDVTTTAETDPASLDPIGYVDHLGPMPSPGRVFQSQLAGPAGSVMSFSDNDASSWMLSQGAGQPAGIDHQTVGGGPYNHNSSPPPPTHPLYSNAVYYCSQDSVTAFCARSDNGGLTFGAGIPIYNLTTCGSLHGHLKVGPDGTVYVPNQVCGSNQALVVSTDNGLTWSIRPIPDSTSTNGSDPSVGIATDGTIYFGYQDGSNHPKIAVSHDHGMIWGSSVDAGTSFNIQNSVFPEVVAGDSNRASFFFLGTSQGGNYEDITNFKGIWHAYVATTFDGGQSYITVDTTPIDPVQVGSICLSLGSNCGADRNLLDFNDATIDAQGRFVGAYADGCVAPSCNATSPSSASRSKLGTILRQSGGPRLFAAFDPVEPTHPAAPQLVSATAMTGGVLLSWLEPDNGGSAITGYNISRGTASGGEMPLATIGGAKSAYFDITAATGTKYFYRVTATNRMGTGPYCGEVSTP